MRESHVPTLLMQQAGMEVGLVGQSIVAQGCEAIMRALSEQATRIIVVDASTMADLGEIAQALHSLGPAWMPCGSAGLAQPWAAQLAVDVIPGKIPAFAAAGGGALFVCGSRNPDTLRQVERLAATDVAHVTLDVNGSYDEARELARLSRLVCDALEQARDTLLEACTVPLLPGGGPRVTRILGGVVQATVDRCLLGGLFMTGGDVAISICRQLGVEALRIVAEIQPGLPAARLIGGLADGLPAATKAGGFGTEDALLDVRRWFDEVRQGARSPLADV
jgi:D-threonate/D-erythronate kinase